MGISPVSSNSNSFYAPADENNAIKILEKQKMQLQDQIRKVNQSKMEDKTKQEKIKSLREQIQQIDMEISQKRSEKLNQTLNSDQKKTSGQTNDSSDDSGASTGLSQLIQADVAYSQAHVINSTKNSLNGKGNVLKIEIKLDEGRGKSTERKKDELHKIESRMRDLTGKAGNKLKETQKEVTEASNAENKDRQANTGEISPDNGDEEQSKPTSINKAEKNLTKVDIRI